MSPETATAAASRASQLEAALRKIIRGNDDVVRLALVSILARGHLLIEDGLGSDRRQTRLPRVGHGLKRLVVIGSDGMISLAALRWLACC